MHIKNKKQRTLHQTINPTTSQNYTNYTNSPKTDMTIPIMKSATEMFSKIIFKGTI